MVAKHLAKFDRRDRLTVLWGHVDADRA